MRDAVLVYINGRAFRVSGDEAFLTLAEFLRRRAGLTGTKVVCAEGDCGSCATLIGRPVDGAMRYAAVTSCIQLMLQLDGAHVVTVEGLWDGAELNPIQQAMVTCQGTQCGFCTPGFVVSLYDLMHDGRAIDRQLVCRGLVGNLCRCTGYESIILAALSAGREGLKSLDALYPPVPLLEALTRAAGEEVSIQTATMRRFFKALTLQAAVRFRAENPACTIIAGGTDLCVVHNKRTGEITCALAIGAIPELTVLRREADALYVGAGATLSALERAALEHLPVLGLFLAWFGSPLIKNAGTLAGNLVTGSPIGDTLPALTVLGAEIDIVGIAGRRRVPIGEFYTGYRKTVLAPDELVVGVRIPLPSSSRHEHFRLYKVSRRKDLDISAFAAAILVRRGSDGNLAEVRIAYGGVGPMIFRMTRVEAMLAGEPPTLALFQRAAEVAAVDVTPITDVRGSESYRRALAGNILLKFWHDEFAAESTGGNNRGGNGSPAPPSPIRSVAPAGSAPLVARSPEAGR